MDIFKHFCFFLFRHGLLLSLFLFKRNMKTPLTHPEGRAWITQIIFGSRTENDLYATSASWLTKEIGIMLQAALLRTLWLGESEVSIRRNNSLVCVEA